MIDLVHFSAAESLGSVLQIILPLKGKEAMQLELITVNIVFPEI
jgi:hypothetical protein